MLKFQTTPKRREVPREPLDVLDLQEASRLLRLSDKTLRSLAVAGEVPARRVGSQWRFSRRALMAYLEGDTPAGVKP